MNGLNEIILEGLSVVPEQRDTLLTLTSTRVKLNFWKLLSRKIKIRYVAADGITLAFTKRDSVANYDFLLERNQNISLERRHKRLPKQITQNESTKY